MRMDRDLHASVMNVAKGLDMSMNEFINMVLEDFVAMDEMYILRLKVKSLGGEVIGYELRVPKELRALQDG